MYNKLELKEGFYFNLSKYNIDKYYTKRGCLKMTKKIICVLSVILIIFSFSAGAISDSQLYDVYNLRVDADFEVDMGDRMNNMLWVPSVSLGKPNTNKVDIYDLKDDLKLAQKEIDNVYETLMFVHLFFEVESGNLKQRSNEISWGFSKPVELTFESKKGNCAAMSSLVNYLLEGDYEEEGLLWRHMNKDADRYGGHVMNYVKHNGDYYFFDVLGVTESNDSYPVENGSLRDQGRVDWADPVIKSKPEEYMKFINGAADFSLFGMFKNDNYIIGVDTRNGEFVLPSILSPEDTKIYVTKGNKHKIKEYRTNPKVPKEYRGTNKYDEYKNNSSYDGLIIEELDF